MMYSICFNMIGFIYFSSTSTDLFTCLITTDLYYLSNCKDIICLSCKYKSYKSSFHPINTINTNFYKLNKKVNKKEK